MTIPAAAFDDARETLVSAGSGVRDGKHPVLAVRTMYVTDPEGNEVELISPEPVIALLPGGISSFSTNRRVRPIRLGRDDPDQAPVLLVALKSSSVSPTIAPRHQRFEADRRALG